MTLHPGYAATWISSNLNGSTKQFGWLQAPATNLLLSFPLNVTWDSISVRDSEIYRYASITRTLVSFDLSLVGHSPPELRASKLVLKVFYWFPKGGFAP
jgi:hypothetical protein